MIRDVEDIEIRFENAWKHRQAYIESNKIAAFRMITRDELELPLAVDLVKADGSVSCIFQVYDEELPEEMIEAVYDLMRLNHQAKAFYIKKRYRVKEKADDGGNLAEQAVEVIIEEFGHKFLLNLNNYLDIGLFLDHRETRRRFQKMVSDFEAIHGRAPVVLNMFAYTGSFSIYAAAGGADKTHTVDLSKTYCDWARRNMKLNNFEEEKNWIYRMDSFEFLKYATKKGLKFDLAIIDPPTFSRNKGINWSVQKDHAALLLGLKALCNDNAEIIFSNNCLDFKLANELEKDFKIQEITHETVPLDFWRRTDGDSWWQDSGQIHNCYLLKKR